VRKRRGREGRGKERGRGKKEGKKEGRKKIFRCGLSDWRADKEKL
jgi:hypothetical protein